MENNIDLILAQLHKEEEKPLLLAGLVFVEAQQGVPSRRRQRRRRRSRIKPYLQRRPLFDSMKICWSNCTRKKEKITRLLQCTFFFFVEGRTWLPSSLWKNVLDSDHVTKYLHRTIVALSSYYNRSKSYYSLNEQYDYSTIFKFKNVLRMHTMLIRS